VDSKFKIPAQYHTVQQEIQKSRFITHIEHTPTKEDALAFINCIRTEHSRATHNCWAYVAGEPGSSRAIGMSDDGEPHGTAGPPMLQVLQHCGIGEITAVVTRYYGGIKLGTGGLVRAYSGSVTLGLETLPTAWYEEISQINIIIPYAEEANLRKFLDQHNATIETLDYSDVVKLILKLPSSKTKEFQAMFYERISNGTLKFEA